MASAPLWVRGFIGWPILNYTCKACLFCGLCHAFHSLGASGDGFDNIVVTGATADVAFEFFTDRVLGQFVALAVDHIDRGHDHARRAITALQSMMLAEGRLHGMQFRTVGEAFNGGDMRAFAGDGQSGAAFDGLTIDVDNAGAALAGIATDMGSGQSQILAQKCNQQRVRLNVACHCFAVHSHMYCCHYSSPVNFLESLRNLFFLAPCETVLMMWPNVDRIFYRSLMR